MRLPRLQKSEENLNQKAFITATRFQCSFTLHNWQSQVGLRKNAK
jgi:hypothetical protein